jgi:hypothetical protein
MEMPQLTPGHEKFERMAGRWIGEETMHPSPWDPAGGTATGETSSRVALGGFALIIDYTQTRDGAVTFTGHGVWTFDAKRDLYVLHWFDSIGGPPEIFEGRPEGEVLTVSHGGPGMHARLTYNMENPDVQLNSMEMSQDGVDWKTLFDGRYTRT